MTSRKWIPARIVKVWLTIVFWLCVVGAVVLTTTLVVAPFRADTPDGVEVQTPIAIGSHTFIPRMPLEVAPPKPDAKSNFHHVRLVKAYGELRAGSNDVGLHAATMGSFLVWLLVVMYGVWLLREIVENVLAGKPFARMNSRYFRRIGLITLGLALVGPLAEYQLGRAVLARLSVGGLTLSPALRFSEDACLLGLLFLVLAAIFSYGTELEEDRTLTI
jgi:hypothetical protein